MQEGEGGAQGFGAQAGSLINDVLPCLLRAAGLAESLLRGVAVQSFSGGKHVYEYEK